MLQTTLTYHEFKSLDMHEQLTFVIICTSGIDSTIPDFRLERIRMPQIDRIYRLDIIMTIDKHGRQRRIHHLLAEDHRMTGSRIYGSLISTRLHKKFHKSFGTTLHIRLMLLKRAHRRNSEQREEFLKETLLVCFNILFHNVL